MKGGFIIVPRKHKDRVNAAILKFQQEVTDKNATILPTYNTVRNIVRLPDIIPCCRILSLTQKIE